VKYFYHTIDYLFKERFFLLYSKNSLMNALGYVRLIPSHPNPSHIAFDRRDSLNATNKFYRILFRGGLSTIHGTITLRA